MRSTTTFSSSASLTHMAWLQVNFVSVDLSSALWNKRREGDVINFSKKVVLHTRYKYTQCNKNSLCGTGFTPHAWQPALAKTLRDILYILFQRGGEGEKPGSFEDQRGAAAVYPWLCTNKQGVKTKIWINLSFVVPCGNMSNSSHAKQWFLGQK